MKKTFKLVFWAALIVLLSGFLMFLIPEYKYRYSSAVLVDTIVKIYPNADIVRLATEFQKGGIIENSGVMERFYVSKLPQSIKAGNYKLEKGMSYRTLLGRFVNGRQSPVRLTFNNIRTLDQLAGRVSRYTLSDSLSFLKYFRNDSLHKALGVTMQTLPWLFLPNTYEVYWTITPAEFVDKMKQEHDKFWNAERLQKADRLGFTPLQITTIASIVIEETKASSEMSTVAGVYINRLRKDMPLQADPTVKFAMGDFTIKRVLNKHLETPSPYNTYKNKGLPPGPICIPNGIVIDAVLNYAEHNYYYFCAKADFSGTHAFARNLSEHNRNAATYQRELNRLKIK